MKLGNATLRPGRILEVSTDVLGEIKAEAPGLFSKEDPTEKLPPIMPFFLLHPNSYSTPVVDEEVWIINFNDNPRALFWLKKDDYKVNLDSFKDNEVLEVFCYRDLGDDKKASLYFSTGEGWMMSSNGIINIDKDGQIHIKSQGESIINVTNEQIDITSPEGSVINITNEQIDINSPGGTQVLVKDDNVQINAGSTVNITDKQIDINSPGGTQAVIKDNNIQLKTNSSGSIDLSPGSVKLANGMYSAVNGEQLKILLDSLLTLITTAAAVPIAPGSPPVAFGAVGALLTQTANILAKNVKVS